MRLTVQEAKIVAPEGLKDGGKVVLSCSNCKAGLMTFWITRPGEIDPLTNKPFDWRVQANCPFCGDKSFVKSVKGGFHITGFNLPSQTDEDEATPITKPTGEFDEKAKDDHIVLFFKVEKGSPDAKAIIVR